MAMANAMLKNEDLIEALLDDHKKKDWCMMVSKLKYIHYQPIYVVLLFFYLIVVA